MDGEGQHRKQGSEWPLALDTVERLGGVGTWRWCRDTGQLECSANLFRMLGLDPGELSPWPEPIIAAAALDDRARLGEELRLLADGVHRPPIDYRLARGGGVRYVRAESFLTESSTSGGRWLCGVVKDITDQAWAGTETDVTAR